jgi:FkbM family methyltransferase
MISFLFNAYRRAPYWVKDLVGRSTWPLRIVMLPANRIRIGGHVMALDFRDNASFKYYVDREDYERESMAAFLRAIALNPGSTVIDAGANYGAFSLAAAARLGNLGLIHKIYAIEPDTRAFGALQRSVKINGFSSLVEPMRLILGDRAGEATLYENARSSADNRSHRVGGAGIRVRRSYQVPCVTLDSLVESAGEAGDGTFVVKMDIEGNEFRALRGMVTTLRRCRGFVLLFEHCPYLIESAGLDIDEYHRFLERLGVERWKVVTDKGLLDLGDFAGFLASVQSLRAQRDPRFPGLAGNYVIARGMKLEW